MPQSEYQKQWIKNNPDKIKAQRERYLAKHGERVKEARSKKYYDNKPEHQARNKQYYQEHSEEIKTQKKGYYQKNKEWIKAKSQLKYYENKVNIEKEKIQQNK